VLLTSTINGGFVQPQITEMSYFPVLSAPGCEGWVGLSNFSPNNWEIRHRQSQFINVTWASNGVWMTKNLGTLEFGACKTFGASDVADIVPESALPLFSLTRTPLAAKSEVLPRLDSTQTLFPAWRATLGLSSPEMQTSYQGELDAFPTQGSLLTFGPFVQFGEGVRNYLILLNVEDSAVSRLAELEIYDAAGGDLRGTFAVKSNACTAISLDDLGFGSCDLPLFVCRSMASIPLYLSSAGDGAYLSLEHTHPPASLVVHGRRSEAQKLLKTRWFAKVSL
jgi:hypothetical protein